jgi:hypothetical protein
MRTTQLASVSPLLQQRASPRPEDMELKLLRTYMSNELVDQLIKSFRWVGRAVF